MSKARTEVPLRCLGTAISLVLLIINTLGAVILFVFGPFFLLRAYASIYFGIFSIIVVLSLIVSMIAFSWPDRQNLINALANRYWLLIVMIAARGAWLTYDVWAAQDTLVDQCQVERKIGQSSGAFVTELAVDSFVTCSDGVWIFVIITLTTLSIDLFLHIAISICSRGLLNIYHEAEFPSEVDQDHANFETERRSGPYVKHAGNITGRNVDDSIAQGYRAPSLPRRILNETYAPNTFQPISPYPHLYDSTRQRTVNSTSQAPYTFPTQTNRASYQTIQSAERCPTTCNQNGGQVGGFAEQQIISENTMRYGRRKIVPISTCRETDTDRYTYQALPRPQRRRLPNLYPRPHNLEPMERHRQAVLDTTYRINSVSHNADTENHNSLDSFYPATPIPARDGPFVLPCQVRFVESPTAMEFPLTPASTAQEGTHCTPPKDNLPEKSVSNISDGPLETLSENCTHRAQLLVANPDITEKTEESEQDDAAKSVETEEGSRHDTTNEVLDTTRNDDSGTPGRLLVEFDEGPSPSNEPDSFTQMPQSTLPKKPSLMIDHPTRHSSTEDPYRNSQESNHRFSNPYFRRRPYPYKKRRGLHFTETKRFSKDRSMVHNTGDPSSMLGVQQYEAGEISILTLKSDAGFVNQS